MTDIGNPVDPPHGHSSFDRTSAPVTAGHAAYSTGDHGVGQGRSPGLAVGHLDLRQSTTSVVPLCSLETAEAMDGTGAYSPFAPGRVAVSRFDAAAASGLPGPPANPADRLPPHIAPQNTTGPDGGHSLGDPSSHLGMRNSDAVRVMREAMFGPRQ
jgi:hypothetical protein